MIDLQNRNSGHRLNSKEWDEICVLFKAGKSYSEIMSQYPISRNGLINGLRKRGVEKGSYVTEEDEDVIERIRERTIDESFPFMSKRRENIEETRRQHYQYAEAIAKLIMMCLVNAQKKGNQFAQQMNNIKALQIAGDALAKARSERYAILSADSDIDETVLPELQIRDLTQEEIRDLQSRGEDEYSDEEEILDDGSDIVNIKDTT